MLIAGQVARAAVLVLGALAWRAGYDGAPTLFAIALAFGVAAGLTLPSGMALIRQIVSPDDFGTVMGWNQVSGRVMRLLGAPAGGILVAWGGLVAAMVVDAATFAVIAVVLALVVRARYRLPRAEQARWRDSFTDGMGYLRRTPTARTFVIGLTALNVFVSPVVALGLALRVEGSAWGPHVARHRRRRARGRCDRRQPGRDPVAADVRRGLAASACSCCRASGWPWSGCRTSRWCSSACSRSA